MAKRALSVMSQWDRPGFQCGFNSTIGLMSAIAKPDVEQWGQWVFDPLNDTVVDHVPPKC